MGYPPREGLDYIMSNSPMSSGSPQEQDVMPVVELLIDEGFKPSDMVVLCGSMTLANKLRERTAGPYSFGLWGSQGIAVETISRFKGLDAQAVVLALPSVENLTEAYVGMSRARSVLFVIGDESSRSRLNWPPSK